ncbi:MAG TPA: XRE family transcriptional regulator [Acidobacteriota bacterium]|nr:XRE family transcriptional regulator [Acidobacteriota bacterium]
MKRSNAEKPVSVKTAEELGRALGLSAADAGEMELRAELTCALAKIIRNGRLTHREIVKKAGTSRTLVTAFGNGNTQGMSTDLLICVLSATAYKDELRVRRTGA